MNEDDGLRWLFLDMNSFFASCEQQENPSLRGRPVAVVPMKAENTCVIAASYEAKSFGVKTGTLVKEARRLCPAVVFVVARPKAYVAFHHRFLDAVERCIPVEEILSVDEVACRLDRTERSANAARQLALRIKTVMHETVGECLTCSIGVASNKLLSKLASDMRKPDGLTILRPRDLPRAILHLDLHDIPGIGLKMEERLFRCGLCTMADLWNADVAVFRRAWGGVLGARFHALLHGVDLPDPPRLRRSISHQHVLPPQDRSFECAKTVARQLLCRTALRLRRERLYCGRLIVDVKWQGDLGHYITESRFSETQDTAFLLRIFLRLWSAVPRLNPLKVCVILSDFTDKDARQYSLFRKPNNEALTACIDRLNEKYGRECVRFGAGTVLGSAKIAFCRVPEEKEL